LTAVATAALPDGRPIALINSADTVCVWDLTTAAYHDLGADYYTSRIDKERRKRHLIQQLEALGLQVTLTPAAA
jgi:hypothetical protein